MAAVVFSYVLKRCGGAHALEIAICASLRTLSVSFDAPAAFGPRVLRPSGNSDTLFFAACPRLVADGIRHAADSRREQALHSVTGRAHAANC